MYRELCFAWIFYDIDSVSLGEGSVGGVSRGWGHDSVAGALQVWDPNLHLRHHTPVKTKHDCLHVPHSLSSGEKVDKQILSTHWPAAQPEDKLLVTERPLLKSERDRGRHATSCYNLHMHAHTHGCMHPAHTYTHTLHRPTQYTVHMHPRKRDKDGDRDRKGEGERHFGVKNKS